MVEFRQFHTDSLGVLLHLGFSLSGEHIFPNMAVASAKAEGNCKRRSKNGPVSGAKRRFWAEKKVPPGGSHDEVWSHKGALVQSL